MLGNRNLNGVTGPTILGYEQQSCYYKRNEKKTQKAEHGVINSEKKTVSYEIVKITPEFTIHLHIWYHLAKLMLCI